MKASMVKTKALVRIQIKHNSNISVYNHTTPKRKLVKDEPNYKELSV